MDFHSLTRRELQTLCKKNKIPANITNVAMAEALKALQFVEGTEEFLNPSESVTAQSSIESPEKMEVTSPCVPRTGVRTTRRKTAKDEVENSQTLTRTRRSTRKMAETPSARNNGKAPMASVCRKMDAELKDLSETPRVLPSSRRRGKKLTGENTVIRTYSTRRSARLSEKNAADKNIEIVKSALFPEDSGENVENSGRDIEESTDDLGEIIESTDIDLKKEESEGEMERNKVKEFCSDKKSDRSNEDQIEFDSSKLVRESSESFVIVSPEMKVEDNGVEYGAVDDLKTEDPSQVLQEKDHPPADDTFDEQLEIHDAVQEKRCGDLYLNKAEDAPENGDNLDVNQEVSVNLAAETVEKVVLAQDDDASNEEITDLTEDGNSASPDDLFVIEEVHESAEVEKDIEFLAVSDVNVGVEQCSKDLAALDIHDGAVTEGDEKPVAEESAVILPEFNEQGTDLISAQKLLINCPLEEEYYVDNHMVKDTTPQELNASSDLLSDLSPSEEKGNDVVGSFEEEYTVDNNMMKDTTAHELNASPESTATDDKGNNVVVGFWEEEEESDADNNMMKETTAQELNVSAVLLPELNFSDDDEGTDVVGPLEEQYVVNNNMVEETTTMELNACADASPKKKTYVAVDSVKSPIKQQGEAASADEGLLFSNALTSEISCVFSVPAEPNKIVSSLPEETELSHIVLPTCLTPSKKSASKKTPKKLKHPFDDKENNIDNNNNSGSKLIVLTKEKKKNKDLVSQSTTQYVDVSLRKLKKELKERLVEEKKNLKKEEVQGTMVVSSRPALQAVSENMVVEKNNL